MKLKEFRWAAVDTVHKYMPDHGKCETVGVHLVGLFTTREAAYEFLSNMEEPWKYSVEELEE